ncbi:MAG: cytochrome c [Leptospiraceae bacterium]|nr:cytochrome c [Leptospiraceae bacterium]
MKGCIRFLLSLLPEQVQSRTTAISAALLSVPAFLLILDCSDPLANPKIQQARQSVPELHRSGFDQFVLNNCHGCHGLQGGGDGPLNSSGRFDIPNLSQPEQYRHGATVPEIRNSIEFGVEGGRTGMQGYQNIPAEHIENIARYIHWLQNP